MFSSIVVGILGFYYCSLETNASYLGRPHLYGPEEALDGDIVEFRCTVHPYPAEPILFQVFKRGDRNTTLADYTSLDGSAASFSMMVTPDTHEGTLECVVSVQNNSLIQPAVSPPHPFRVVEPVVGVTLAVLSGAEETFEGRTLVLGCEVAYGNHVSYSWLLEDQPLPATALHRHHPQLLIDRATPQHSGNYSCVATNQLNDTMIFTEASSEVLITVKELVSSLVISYVVHMEHSETSAQVTCASSRGIPPITFSLLDNTSTTIPDAKVTVQESYATFRVPLLPDRHRDHLRCQAENGDRAAFSDWMLLHVESVGGPVTLRYEYSTGDDFSVTDVRFYCRAAKGTHPRFQWFFNGTLLEPDAGSFYVVLHQQPAESMLLLPVDSRSRGTYHCQVSDLFDNTTVVRSEKMFLDREVLNRLSDAVVVVVFGCLSLLLACVLTCCAAGVILGRSQDNVPSQLEMKMESMVQGHEDDLDSEEYRENVDVLKAARMEDSDLGSMGSTDEWTDADTATQL